MLCEGIVSEGQEAFRGKDNLAIFYAMFLVKLFKTDLTEVVTGVGSVSVDTSDGFGQN